MSLETTSAIANPAVMAAAAMMSFFIFFFLLLVFGSPDPSPAYPPTKFRLSPLGTAPRCQDRPQVKFDIPVPTFPSVCRYCTLSLSQSQPTKRIFLKKYFRRRISPRLALEAKITIFLCFFREFQFCIDRSGAQCPFHAGSRSKATRPSRHPCEGECDQYHPRSRCWAMVANTEANISPMPAA